MTPSPPTTALPASAEPPPGNAGATIAQASAALLCELEASLRLSQRALLQRDLPGLEQATREQIRLRCALGILWEWDATACKPAARFDGRTQPKLSPAESARAESAPDLRAAQQRVLQLGRIQAALLAGQQRWFTMLANLVAGPDSGYGAAGIRHNAPGVGGPPVTGKLERRFEAGKF